MALIYDVSFDSQTRVLSLLDKAGNVISSCKVSSKRDPLTFTATADDSSVKLIKNGTLSNAYEVDTGNGWKAYTFETAINLNSGESCRWRCSAHPTTQSPENYVKFVMTGKIEASGNVNSMLSSNFEGITSLARYGYAFYKLFWDCESLMVAPQLPATTLAKRCYNCMFYGCTSLTIAPALPATSLAEGCYSGMFWRCDSLMQAPALPATTLAELCYYYMFEDCVSLTGAPQLPATRLAESCYSGMFSGCTSLMIAPALPATTLAELCYDYMFEDCVSLTSAPQLPATRLAIGCYQRMFEDCVSLTSAPQLPATTLAKSCYNCMFFGCESLMVAPELPATTLADYCYYYMFCGCTSLNEVRIAATTTAENALRFWLHVVAASGTVYADPNFDGLPTNSVDGVPSGWVRAPLSDYPATP